MSDQEGFALPLVESTAFGLPVLADFNTIPCTLDGYGLAFRAKDHAGWRGSGST